MPESDEVRKEVTTYFRTRFGVPEEAFAGIRFISRKDTIWATATALPPSLFSPRPPGIRALRRMGTRLKPTSVFLRYLGNRIASSRVEISEVSVLKSLLLGGGIPTSVSPGYVALSFRGEVIGCGSSDGAKVKAMIPTGRRRELLEILDSDCYPHHGNSTPYSGKIVREGGGK